MRRPIGGSFVELELVGKSFGFAFHGYGSCLAALDEVNEPACLLEVLVEPRGGAHGVLGVGVHLLSMVRAAGGAAFGGVKPHGLNSCLASLDEVDESPVV